MKQKQSIRFIITILMVTQLATSCATVRIRTDAAQGDALVCKTCEGKLHRWFWGFVYNEEYLVNNCDSKALQAVQVKTTLSQGLVTVVTLGIYCPVKVKWTCAKED
ncbi:MAG TPA: hypothetical protein PLX35_04265 [Cyclobacteriaceae bacterium]|nr:hypothetical protein [Cyclobacteriaceae bacterium]